MAFLCPACDAAGGLKITRRLELPPDSRSDEITLQIVRCRRCNFEGLAIYEESRRGALGDEAVDHRGYMVICNSSARGKCIPGTQQTSRYEEFDESAAT